MKRMKQNGLKGRVDMQEAVATASDEFVTYEQDTFSITVKDDEGKEVYKNDSEPFKYPKVVGLANYLRHKGAKLTDDQITFLGEALKGDETIDSAYKELIEDLNGLLFARAKQSAYSKVLNEKKPISEETIANSQARMVRDFIRQNPTVSAESAIETLKNFVPSFKDYTLAMFEANKGRV